ncbi:MFS-type transporter SLC18B1-like [Amblyomma americanum]
MSASPAASEARNGLSGTTVGSGVDANGGAAFVNRAFESYERPANGGDVAKTVYPSYGSAVWKEDSQDAVKPSKPKAAEGCWEKLKRDAWLLPLVHSEFWISAAFSLIQPFYPILASSRGIEAWKYGFVFSLFKIFMLIGSVTAEKMINRITPTACYLFGQGGFFIFTILFGCLYWAPGGNVLLGLSIACVVLGGITNTFYLVSMFAVFTTRFPKHRGGIIAFLEFLWGSGNMVGSAIGGVLIDAWAFPLPFFVLGAITMLSFPVIMKLRAKLNQYSEPEECEEDAPEKEGKLPSYYWLLIDPVFLADMVTLMMSWVILGFNEPTLEPSLEKFNLTGTILGSVYTVQFASYSVGGFIAGAFSHYSLETFYAMVGQLFTILAYLLIGPAPFLPLSRSLALVYISQVFTGLGMSAQFVCGYCHGLRRAVQRGYPDNIRTNGFLSSTVFTFAVFGAMVTPPIAGYVVELYGYRKGSMLMFGLLVIWAPATIALWVHSICSGRKAVKLTNSSSRPRKQSTTSTTRI